MDRQTLAYYQSNAAEVSNRYEQAQTSISSLLLHLFKPGSTVLDIGCGSGRDLAALIDAGIDGYGLEPSSGMISSAQEAHPELYGKIFQGGLPEDTEALESRTFDGVLVSAVLMHIPDEELFQSAYTVRSLLKIGGRLVISVPTERDDVRAEENRDAKGRLMILRPPARIRLLFERLGFEFSGRWESSDGMNRRGVKWVTLVFDYRGTAISESVDRIESIINRDTKTATYKLALLKALCDIALQEIKTAQWTPEGNVQIPLESVSRKWTEYYWPIVSYSKFIPQTTGANASKRKCIRFRDPLTELASGYEKRGGINQFIHERDSNTIRPDTLEIYRKTEKEIQTAIVQGPVRYAGGGSNENKPFHYDKNTRSIVFSADIWREFVLLGHWIGDSINIRWAELTRQISGETVDINSVLALLMETPAAERNTAQVRSIFETLPEVECVWSGRNLHKFDVDHAIPYVLRHDNPAWNLFPVQPKINNAKRDKLPSSFLLERSRDRIIYYWETINRELTGSFSTDYLRFTGKQDFDDENWKSLLFNYFREEIETTAHHRGIERWEP